VGVALLAGSASAQPADVVRARQLLAEARTVAEKDTDGPGKAVLAEVAGAQARAGDRQAALATATALGITWGWKAAAKGFADAGDLGAALEFAGKIVDGKDVLNQAAGVNLEREDTLREIALRRAQRGDVNGALRAIREIGFSPMAARAYAALAEAQARAGDAAGARRTLALAESTAGQAQPNPVAAIWQSPAYDDIGKAWWHLGDRTAALKAFDRGLGAARSTPDGYRDGAIAFNAADRAETGDVAGALRVLKEVREPHQPPAASEVARLSRALAAAGQHDRAMELAAIAANDRRSNAFAEIGEAYFRKGDKAHAAQAFSRAIAAAEKQSDTLLLSASIRDVALLEVARSQARAGDREGALRTAARIPRRGPKANDEMTDDYLYDALATGQIEAGDVEGAWRTIALVKGYPPQPEMWRALGRAEGRGGNVDAVLARAPSSSERRRAAFLTGLAEGLVERAESRHP
jgi:tetratricopeptide (TPR) repeat protein